MEQLAVQGRVVEGDSAPGELAHPVHDGGRVPATGIAGGADVPNPGAAGGQDGERVAAEPEQDRVADGVDLDGGAHPVQEVD
jgi:hypothetical protein